MALAAVISNPSTRAPTRAVVAALAAVPTFLLLLPVFGIAGVLFLFAASVRTLGRMLEPRFEPWTSLIGFDPTLGWRPKAGLDTHYLAEGDDVFHVVTDAEGWTGPCPLDRSAVVVVGDSFAFGYGVDCRKSFAHLNPRLGITAIGAPGYSMVQGVLLLEQLAHRLAGKLVVWFVFPENDLQDNLSPEMRGYRAPFVRPSDGDGGWEIVDSHVGPSPWLCSDLDKKRLFRHFCAAGPLADRAYSASDYLIGRASALCRQVGARLVVLTIPHPVQLAERDRRAATSDGIGAFDEELPDRRIATSCQRHQVPFIAGLSHLSWRDYKRREGIHWNERGHRRMSALLGDVYQHFRSGTLDTLVPHNPGAAADHRMTTRRHQAEALVRS